MNIINDTLIASDNFSLRRVVLFAGLLALFLLCFFSMESWAQGLMPEQVMHSDDLQIFSDANSDKRQTILGSSDNFTGAILIPGFSALRAVADQSFFVPESWARELTSEQGDWGSDHPRMLADVNGDGKQDVVGFGDDGVWLATSTGTKFELNFVLNGFGYKDSWRIQKHVRTVGDINGDKLDDIVGFGDAGVYQALSTGTGFSEAAFVVANFGYNQGWRADKHVRLLADVNGDGRKDIVGFGDDGVWLSLATSDSFSEPAFVLRNFGFNQGWTQTKHIRTTADVNGDGRQDLVGFGDQGVWIALSTGAGFSTPQFVLANFGYIDGKWRTDRHPRLLTDINGDGKEDIVAFGDDGVWIAYSTGSGFEAAQFVLADFGYNQGWRVGAHPRFVTDLNGDGYKDIVGFGDEFVYRSLGGPEGFAGLRGMLRALIPGSGYPIEGIGFPWNSAPDVLTNYFPRMVGDVDGNGMQDLVAFDRADIKVVRSSNLPPSLPPAAPSIPRVTGNTTTSLSIKWKDNSNDERRFFINYGKTRLTELKVVDANVNTTVLGELDSDTKYCFNVQAENIWGFSRESASQCGRTKVEQTTPTPPPPTETGFSSVNVFNCNSEQRPVYIWTRDVTQNTWIQRGTAPSLWNGGSCPGSAAPFVVPLQDGHYFWFVAVDPQLIACDGQNNPELSACQKSTFTKPLKGDKNGPALPLSIG